MNEINFYLASASPRRKELLNDMGVEPEVVVPLVEENIEEGKEVGRQLLDFAQRKVDYVIRIKKLDHGLVLGADTMGVIDGTAMGKPQDREDATEMLKKLSGRTHDVLTGMYMKDCVSGKTWEHIESTQVTFRELSDEEIEWYLDLNEWTDKAAAYGIQEKGGVLVEKVDGDYFNVVGLPIGVVWKWLWDRGFRMRPPK